MPKRGSAPTPAQRAALAAGQETKRKMAEEAKAAGAGKAKERWAMLLSGTLTVRDLDDKEVAKMRVRGKDGGFSGKARAIPSHLINQFVSEQLRRANDRMRKALPDTVDVLVAIMKDPEAKHSDQIRAAQLLQDRILGKAPETVRIESANEWDSLFVDSVDIDRADLDSEAAALVEEQE